MGDPGNGGPIPKCLARPCQAKLRPGLAWPVQVYANTGRAGPIEQKAGPARPNVVLVNLLTKTNFEAYIGCVD